MQGEHGLPCTREATARANSGCGRVMICKTRRKSCFVLDSCENCSPVHRRARVPSKPSSAPAERHSSPLQAPRERGRSFGKPSSSHLAGLCVREARDGGTQKIHPSSQGWGTLIVDHLPVSGPLDPPHPPRSHSGCQLHGISSV